VHSLRSIDELPLTGVDVVVESTGVFTKRADLEKHLRNGVHHVVLTAPASSGKDADITVVMGVNEQSFDYTRHRIISNASCTTNCLAPVTQVLQENFGVRQGMMNTVHAYTNDQKLQDVAHKDLRRARAAAINIIPTSTGAARAIGLVLPSLAGRLDGMALRVPVEDGSCIYLVAELEREVTQEELVAAFEEASNTARYNSLTLSRDKLVSRDIIGTEHSAIVDAEYLKVLGGRGRMVQVLAWYDNEWAYACRVVDLIQYIGQQKSS
jgi:glyceraldehyde 3-phosphate dehydrogenase